MYSIGKPRSIFVDLPYILVDGCNSVSTALHGVVDHACSQKKNAYKVYHTKKSCTDAISFNVYTCVGASKHLLSTCRRKSILSRLRVLKTWLYFFFYPSWHQFTEYVPWSPWTLREISGHYRILLLGNSAPNLFTIFARCNKVPVQLERNRWLWLWICEFLCKWPFRTGHSRFGKLDSPLACRFFLPLSYASLA